MHGSICIAEGQLSMGGGRSSPASSGHLKCPHNQAPPPPSRPAPVPQPPFNIFEELPIGSGTATTALGCNCGYISELRVGYATVNGSPHVASVSFLCTDGVLVSDPAYNPATQTLQTYTVGL